MAQAVSPAERLPRIRSLLVLRDGHSLAEHRFNGGPPLDQPVNVKSASKSLLPALVGIAIERGILDGVEQPVVSVLGSDATVPPDPRLACVKVGNLLSMQASLERTSGAFYEGSLAGTRRDGRNVGDPVTPQRRRKNCRVENSCLI